MTIIDRARAQAGSSLAALALLLTLPGLAPAAATVGAIGTEVVRIGVASDSHIPEIGYLNGEFDPAERDTFMAHTQALFGWFISKNVDAVVLNGDISFTTDTMGADGGVRALAVIDSLQDLLNVPIYPVPGNHETKYYLLGETTATVPDTTNLFRDFEHAFPACGRRGYYARRHGPVLLLMMAHLTDQVVHQFGVPGDDKQAYANCNPPGKGLAYWQAHGYPHGNPDYVNPDYFGFSDTTSAQIQWAVSRIANHRAHGGTWSVAFWHRAAYAAYNGSSQYSRVLDTAVRATTIAKLIRAGLHLACEADLHVGTFTGPFYKEAVDSRGAWFVCTESGWAGRPTSPNEIPAGGMIYPLAAGLDKGGFAAILTFTGFRCEVEMARSYSSCDPPQLEIVLQKGVEQWAN